MVNRRFFSDIGWEGDIMVLSEPTRVSSTSMIDVESIADS